MEESGDADKLIGAFKDKPWEGCYPGAGMVDIPLILLTDHPLAEAIRGGFQELYPYLPDARYPYGGRWCGGLCAWLLVMCAELSPHFEPDQHNPRPLSWDEKAKPKKQAEYQAIHKVITNLIKLLEGTGMDSKELALSSFAGIDKDKDMSVIHLLQTLDEQIRQTAQAPSALEQYIGKAIRQSKQDALPIDVRVFVSIIARQLVTNLHLDHTPNKLIADIATLKFENHYEKKVTVTEIDVENLTRNLTVNR